MRAFIRGGGAVSLRGKHGSAFLNEPGNAKTAQSR